MKKVLLVILGVIVVLGLLAGAGFTGYRIGRQQGISASGNAPSVRVQPFDRDGMPRFAPGPNVRGLNRGFFFGHVFLMPRFGRMGFFTPLGFVWRILLIVLIVWFIAWLIARSGWRLTRQTQAQTQTETVKSAPAESESTEESGK